LAPWAQQSLKKIRSDLYLLVTELVVRYFTMTTSMYMQRRLAQETLIQLVKLMPCPDEQLLHPVDP
jgi:hypothetical protein